MGCGSPGTVSGSRGNSCELNTLRVLCNHSSGLVRENGASQKGVLRRRGAIQGFSWHFAVPVVGKAEGIEYVYVQSKHPRVLSFHSG